MSAAAPVSAEEFAMTAHGEQQYGDSPCHHHLASVVEVLRRFGHDDPEVIDAAWLHDTIEATDVTRRQIARRFGERVAEIVWAVTNEDGADPRERRESAYPKIAADPEAITVKLADRIANTEAARSNDPGRYRMYDQEYGGFRQALCPAGGDPAMWEHLDALYADGQSGPDH